MDEQLTKLQPQQDNQTEALARLIQPVIPVVQAYLESQTRDNEKDRETEQMSVQFDYKLRDKTLDYERAEQKESRDERRELRRWGLLICLLLTIVLVVAFFREKEAAAMELIKLLAIGIGAITASHYHAKYKAAISKKERSRQMIESDDDDAST